VQQFTPPTLTGSSSHVPRVLPDTRGPALALYSKVTPHPSSQSILVDANGVHTTVVNPSQDQITAASRYYQGGRVYIVTDDEAAALTAAGYTVTPL
jgi:hypothetical protein